MSMKSFPANRIIAINLDVQILKLKSQRRCFHTFEEYGYGYECTSCGYYTGGNETINDAIKESNEQTIQSKPEIEF